MKPTLVMPLESREILQDGAEAIAAAHDHISVESYIVDDRGSGQEMLRHLVARCREGVQINLAFDAAGCIGTSRRVFDSLRAEGVNLLEHHPLHKLSTWLGSTLQRRNHRKLMIVDGRVGFIGGLNISGVYGSPPHKATCEDGNRPWRDTHARVLGPVVGELQRLFIENWRSRSGLDRLKERTARRFEFLL